MTTDTFVVCSALLVSLISLTVAFLTYYQDHRRRKKQSTIEYYSNMANELYPLDERTNTLLGGVVPTPEKLSTDKELLALATKLLSSYERLSVGVNAGIFDFDIIDRMAGSHLIALYARFEPYINSIRNEGNQKYFYVEFEKLAMRIRSNRSAYKNKGRM